MPRRGTVEKHGLEDLVLSLWARDFTAKQISETIQLERGHNVSEGSIYKFMERAREGKVPQAQKILKGRYGDVDYREEIEQLFEESVELKNLIFQRAKDTEQAKDFLKLAREFSTLSKKILDNGKLLGQMDGRVGGGSIQPPSQSGDHDITGEDLLRAFEEGTQNMREPSTDDNPQP